MGTPYLLVRKYPENYDVYPCTMSSPPWAPEPHRTGAPPKKRVCAWTSGPLLWSRRGGSGKMARSGVPGLHGGHWREASRTGPANTAMAARPEGAKSIFHHLAGENVWNAPNQRPRGILHSGDLMDEEMSWSSAPFFQMSTSHGRYDCTGIEDATNFDSLFLY